jgi:hypothetical protein
MTGQPDRDEPRRIIITGNRHGRQGRLDSPLVEVVQGPPIQMGERIEVVESREPFPSDEAEIARIASTLSGDLYLFHRDVPDGQDPYQPINPRELVAHVLNEARAVLDAVSSHRDDEAQKHDKLLRAEYGTVVARETNAAYARAVSDVVEALRNEPGRGHLYDGFKSAAGFIEGRFK